MARNLRDRFGAESASFLFLDIVGRRMVRVTEEADPQQGRRADQIPLVGSIYNEVLKTQKLVQAPDGGRGERVLAPVTNRGDAIGVLELFLPEVSDDVLQQIEEAAHAPAYIVVTDRRLTDPYHWGRRTTPMSPAAEIQRQLLPTSPSCEAAEFTLACALVPADSIAGDTYDYTLDHGRGTFRHRSAAAHLPMRERQAETIDLPDIIRNTASEHPREVVRTLTAAVIGATDHHPEDDATVLCLDWHGPAREDRHADAGSDT